MVALEEFANFLIQHMANLAGAYAQSLAEAGHGYETLPAETRLASARKLLRAVIESCKTESSEPLCSLVQQMTVDGSLRWPPDFQTPSPLLEIECLGKTLNPVVTNLEAGKFLWQTLQEARELLVDSVTSAPVSPPPSKTIREFGRVEEYETVIQVGTAISSLQDPAALLQSVVDLTKNRFNLYHAHIYLLDEEEERLILAAGADDVGRKLTAQGWSIPLHREQSLVARSARERQCIIVNDVQNESGYLPNPLLPHTRSEMAVPLVVGQQLLGVLDVQSDEVNHFTEEDDRLHSALASLVAVALNNARLYDEIQQALSEVEESQGLLRTVIDATPDWILIRDRQRRYRLVNRGYASVFRLTPEDFLGKTDAELGLPEEFIQGNPEKGWRGFLHDDREVMAGGEPLVNPYEPVAIDGQLRILHSIRAPLRRANGEVWAVLTFARDVTEREQFLADVESLYRAGTSLNQAQTFDDILAALREYTLLGSNSQNVSLNRFDRTWTKDQMPEWIEVLARWSQLPSEVVSNRYRVADFPSIEQVLQPDSPTLIENIADDPRLDDNARALYVQRFGAQSTIFVPLVVSGEWIGYVNAIYQQPTTFPETEVRRLTSLAGQAAVAVQAIYQLQTAERLVRREQTIREITEQMRGATNLQELLRIAAQELGQHLSAGHTVIELGINPDDHIQ